MNIQNIIDDFKNKRKELYILQKTEKEEDELDKTSYNIKATKKRKTEEDETKEGENIKRTKSVDETKKDETKKRKTKEDEKEEDETKKRKTKEDEKEEDVGQGTAMDGGKYIKKKKYKNKINTNKYIIKSPKQIKKKLTKRRKQNKKRRTKKNN